MVSPVDAEPDGRPDSKEIDMATPNAIVTKAKPITLPPLPWADNALA